jgi:hypothetical protein
MSAAIYTLVEKTPSPPPKRIQEIVPYGHQFFTRDSSHVATLPAVGLPSKARELPHSKP